MKMHVGYGDVGIAWNGGNIQWGVCGWGVHDTERKEDGRAGEVKA